jgi:5'-3' exonuclease
MAIVIDADHLVHRLYFSQMAQIGHEPNLLAHMLLNSILKSAEKFRASKENPIFIAIDSHSWRKDWFLKNKPASYPEMKSEGYKGNRGEKDDSWKKVYEIYHGVMGELGKNSDFHVLKVPRAEADDIVAVVTRLYKDTQEVIVVSSDKDFQQLQDGDKVKIFDPFTQDFKPVVDPVAFKKMHTMMGDGSDNIAQCRPKLGPGTAAKLLKDLDSILATDRQFRERYECNRVLIDFDYIPEEITTPIEEAVRSCTFNYNCMNLISVFSKYRLAQLAEKVGKFKLPEASAPQQMKASDAVKRAIQGSLEDLF